MPRLIVPLAGGASAPFELPEGETLVGRGKDCALVVDGEGISRRHAVVRWDGRECRIEDVGSLNGTFVNDRRIQRATLQSGDRIRLGPSLVLEYATDAAPGRGGLAESDRSAFGEPEQSRPGDLEASAFGEPEQSRPGDLEASAFGEPERSAPGRFAEGGFADPGRSGSSWPPPGEFAEPGGGAPPEPHAAGPTTPRPDEFQLPRPTRRGGGGGGGWWRRHELLLSGGADGRVAHRITQASVTVGSDPDCGLRLEGPGVARLHARIDRHGDRWTINDLVKSAEGTRVNGRHAIRADLADGDRVRFGEREFVVALRSSASWGRVAGLVVVLVGLVVIGVLTPALVDRYQRYIAVKRTRAKVERAALLTVQDGIASFRSGRFDLACGHLRYAADLLTLVKAVPRGATLERANTVFARIAARLPEADRGFDFAAVFDSATAAESRAEIENLSDSAYVLREVRRIAVEVGQSEHVPPGFAAEVWSYVQETMRNPGRIQGALRRSRTVQPTLLRSLGEAHLPPVFAYVAWVESSLDPYAVSGAGAVGLWQFMSATATRYHLIVTPGYDQRTNVELSTRAATAYISDLILIFGPEQFMCAMASYNRGEGGVQGAMMKIPQQLTMMPSSEKYWYLVEHRLLPDETSRYVPRIFATKIMAENPARFGFTRP